MIDELKPCPFCGERLEEVEQGSEYFRHSNNGCFFSWHEFDMGGHSSMAKNWNRRARAIPEGNVVVPGWLPIESAPKGSGLGKLTTDPDYVAPPAILLLFEEGQIAIGYWDWYYAEGGRGYEGGLAWISPEAGERLDLHYDAPIGWMPLPAAPANKEGA